MAHYSYNPDAKYGEPHHKTTMRELFDAMRAVDPTHPVWDSPIDIGGGDFVTAYKFSVEDITGDCDGSCENPTCVYALDVKTNGGENAGYDGGAGDVPPGYTDEGLHFAPVLWTNNGGTRY